MRGVNLSGYQQNIAIGYKPCPYCGSPMKTDARVCPRCGQGIPSQGLQDRKRNYLQIVVAILGLMLVIAALLLLSQK